MNYGPSRWRWIGILLAALILPAYGAWASSLNVVVGGVQVGTLTVTEGGGGTLNDASATITANFSTTGQQAGGQAILDEVAPLGLTFMQTVTINTNLQQYLFFPSDTTEGNIITYPNGSPFSDPTYGGYVLYNGTTELTSDTTPWYSTIAPAGTPGALPQTYGWQTGSGTLDAQMYDQPSTPWANQNGSALGLGTVYGLANLLNGQNGSIEFEDALVGQCNAPANPLTGTWDVCVLADYTWGETFTYDGGGSAGHYTSADYTETLTGVTFAGDDMVSDAFEGAFDQLGSDASVEWNVDFTQAGDVPEPGGFTLLAGGALGLWICRRRMART